MKSGKFVAVKSGLSNITFPLKNMVDKEDPITIVLAENASEVDVPKFNMPAFMLHIPEFSLLLLLFDTTIEASEKLDDKELVLYVVEIVFVTILLKSVIPTELF